MRCSKCGSYINNDLSVCPFCGNIIEGAESALKVQGEIGSKIDKILNGDNLSDDFVSTSGEEKAYSDRKFASDTIKFTAPDTVFFDQNEKRSRADDLRTEILKDDLNEQYHWDSMSDWDSIGEETNKIFTCEESKALKGDEVPVVHKRTMESTRDRKDSSRNSNVRGKRSSMPNHNDNRRASSHGSKRKKKKKQSYVGIIMLLIIVAVILAAACIIYFSIRKNNDTGSSDISESTGLTEDSVICNLKNGGSYSLPLEITLESTAGNRIYYTLDGSEPSVSSYKYITPVEITADDIFGDTAEYTLNAVTYTQTSIKKVEFSIKFSVYIGDLSAPQFSLEEGTYTSDQGITITAEKGADIYYTYDGSTPTVDSWLYSGTISMKEGTNTISAIAVKGERQSSVSSATYTLELEEMIPYDTAKTSVISELKNSGYTLIDNASDAKDDIYSATVLSNGSAKIDGGNYYIFYSSIYKGSNNEVDGWYYAVNSSDGSVSYAGKNNDGTFYLN